MGAFQSERAAPLRQPVKAQHLAKLHVSAHSPHPAASAPIPDHSPLLSPPARTHSRDFIEPSFEHLTPCLRSKKAGYESYRGESVFSYLAKNPAENQKFGIVMQYVSPTTPQPSFVVGENAKLTAVRCATPRSLRRNMNLIVGGPLATDYDWTRFNGKTIVDVGGGVGAMPALLVMPYPELKFHVQDLEEPTQQGREVSWRARQGERW